MSCFDMKIYAKSVPNQKLLMQHWNYTTKCSGTNNNNVDVVGVNESQKPNGLISES